MIRHVRANTSNQLRLKAMRIIALILLLWALHFQGVGDDGSSFGLNVKLHEADSAEVWTRIADSAVYANGRHIMRNTKN